MNTYELINPSDPMTFQAPDLEVAALVIALLSTKFGAKCLDNPSKESDVPLFIFGGFTEWWNEHFDPDIKARLEARKVEVSASLRSILHGDERAREEFAVLVAGTPEGSVRNEITRRWNDDRRTSLTDISGAAFWAADALERSGTSEASQNAS